MRKNLLILTATALISAAHAQTTANAVVKAPGQQPMVMPLNVHMLPYGTVTIADGTYFIANYEGTGISIYIQSPTPLRIATVEEMMRYQAEWLRITDAITKTTAGASVPAPTVQSAQNVTLPASAYLAPASPATAFPSASGAFAGPPAITPAPATAPAAVTAPGAPTVTLAAPATRPLNTFPTQAAPIAPPAAPPVAPPAAPAPSQAASFPVATQVFTPAPAAAAPAASPLFPATAASAFAASAAAPAFPATATTAFAPSVAPQASQPAALQFINAPVTLLPRYVRPSFTLRGNTIGYSLTNTSADRTVMIDPQSLRIYQGSTPMSAEMTLRDSLSGQMSGTLYPRAMLTGTVTFKPQGKEPITMTWEVKDDQGRTHPITQRWSLE